MEEAGYVKAESFSLGEDDFGYLAALSSRLLKDGRVNLQKAAEIVMTDFRSAILGRITLETPAEFEAWRAAGLAEDAKRQAKKDARARAKGKGSGVREPAPDSDAD